MKRTGEEEGTEKISTKNKHRYVIASITALIWRIKLAVANDNDRSCH